MLDITELNTKARRNLKKKDLEKLYTELELSELLDTKKGDDKWSVYSDVLRSNAKVRKKHRRWSHIEDKFLIDTYAYLSDTVIALALNIPVKEVTAHRKALKLVKHKKVEAYYVVWCNRENYEDDMQKYNLTKLRGDDVHPLLDNI